MAGSGQSGANQTRILPLFYQPMNNHQTPTLLTSHTTSPAAVFTVIRPTSSTRKPEAASDLIDLPGISRRPLQEDLPFEFAVVGHSLVFNALDQRSPDIVFDGRCVRL